MKTQYIRRFNVTFVLLWALILTVSGITSASSQENVDATGSSAYAYGSSARFHPGWVKMVWLRPLNH